MDKLRQAWATARDALKTCASDAHWYFFGASFLVGIINLTHFTSGVRLTALGLSYADVVCITSIAISLFLLRWRNEGALNEVSKKLVYGASALLVLGYGAMVGALRLMPQLYEIAFIASAVTVGAFIATQALFWFKFFVGRPIETVALSMLVSIVIGCFISWLLLGMTPDRLGVGYALVALFAGWTLVRAFDNRIGPEKRIGRHSTSSYSFLAGPLLAGFLFSFTFMLSISFVGLESWHADVGWSMLWPAALVFGIVALFSRRINIASLLYAALTLVVAAILFASFLHIEQALVFWLATMSCAVNISYLVILFCNLASRVPISDHRLVASLIVAVFGGCLLGKPVAHIVDGIDGDGTVRTLLSICLVITIIICTFVSLGNRTIQLYSNYRFQQQDAHPCASPCASPFFASFAEEHGLGAREREALELLLDGKSASEVADSMFIAQGTAKAHIRHIYQKLDVHDRNELFELMRTVDEGFETPPPAKVPTSPRYDVTMSTSPMHSSSP